jgi:diacylglycerol kinase (ATP)
MMPRVIDPARWYIVVNPASGAGRAARFAPRLLDALPRAGVAFEWAASGAPGDVTRLVARAAARGFRRLLAVGGDGTLNEMLNGLLDAGVPPRECLVAAAAGGTGNDWSRTMEVPDDPQRLAASMTRAAARAADIGLARDGRGSTAAFHTVAGAGIDAEVIRHTPRRGPRRAAYLAGLARALAGYRPPSFEVVADGQAMQGRKLLALASIGPRCGGGMRLTPGAIVDDGWLDLLLLDTLTLAGALRRLPRLFDGRLAGDPAFRVTRCRTATIVSDPPCGVELDGQLFGTTPLTVTIQPGGLNALDCRLAGRELAGQRFSGTAPGSSRASRNPGTGARTAPH